MNGHEISDERLAALADGELPEAEAASLRARIVEDVDLAERYALFVETRELLAPEPSAEADEGLDRLAAALRGASAAEQPAAPRRFGVIEGGGASQPAAAPASAPAARPAPRFRVAAPALAACLALAVGGALGFSVGRSGTTTGTAGGIAAISGAPAADVALASALEKTPSGERLAWTDDGAKLKGAVSVVSTHRLGDGRLCREYEISVEGRDGAVVGLGCRAPAGGWTTEALARSAGGSDYATASGASVIEGAIERLGGEGALPQDDEKGLIAGGWKSGS
ncbi:hypothetical protein ACFOWB_19195 [Chenggangzhangella methanolivorans]|uniref:hypothetical protein n=1 Tax=Chenggangzhangella methanolivorans TaxID=1437009 RepID=UPI0036117645